MPKYIYRCGECDHTFEAIHGMFVKLRNCDECSTDGSLFRVPSMTYSTKNKKSADKKTGELVKEFIEETRKEVDREKAELQREEY